jgi:hypothetical protein
MIDILNSKCFILKSPIDIWISIYSTNLYLINVISMDKKIAEMMPRINNFLKMMKIYLFYIVFNV